MAKFPERNLNQKAVYWGNPKPDGYGGFTYDEAIEIACRWVDKIGAIDSADGTKKATSAEVQVDRDLEEEGMLLLSALIDLDSGVLNAPIDAGAFKIIGINKTPTIKGTGFYRMVYLG